MSTEKIQTSKFRINNAVDFFPEKNKLVSCTTGCEFVLFSTASRCLLLLIINNGEVVRHNLLYKEGWEKLGKVVTPNTLYQTISKLRKQLKNAGVSRNIILTHPRKGWSLEEAVLIEEFRDHMPGNIVASKKPEQITNFKTLYKYLTKFLHRFFNEYVI